LTADGKAVQDAARKAGYELVKEGKMKPETLELVSRPLIGQEELRLRYNEALGQSCLPLGAQVGMGASR
jgi:hypothetical protein